MELNLAHDITSREECEQLKDIMEIYFIRSRIKQITQHA
jgi:hypothetical protein